MGLFRLSLAFCVVLSHGLNIAVPAATADVAVQTFYIVSGFYMGLVLTEKYHRVSSFFTSSRFPNASRRRKKRALGF